MRRFGWTPSIVPNEYDQTVYIVLDDFGRNGRAYRETDVEGADLEATVLGLLEGQFLNPLRIVAFNTIERWSEDASEDIARNYVRAATCNARCAVLFAGIRRPLSGPLPRRRAAAATSIEKVPAGERWTTK